MVLARVSSLLVLSLALLLILPACSDGASELGAHRADSDLLYGDEFSAEFTGPWITEGDEFGSTSIQDGRMVIDVSQADSMQFTTLQEPEFTDFDLTVETQLIEGDRNATYGLLFRMSGPDQFYRFEVTGDGRYVVERRDVSGNWQRLVQGWPRSSAIMTGPGSVNSLRVTADGPALSLYINDELLEELQDATYGGGKIALDAGTFGQERTIVAFDNLAIRAP